MFGNFWLQEISIHLIILKSLLRNFVSACVLILLENDRNLPHIPLIAVPPLPYWSHHLMKLIIRISMNWNCKSLWFMYAETGIKSEWGIPQINLFTNIHVVNNLHTYVLMFRFRYLRVNILHISHLKKRILCVCWTYFYNSLEKKNKGNFLYNARSNSPLYGFYSRML